MPHDTRDRKARSAGRHRLHDVSHIKLMDIFKSLRHRRLRKDVSRRTSLTHSRTHSPPFTDHGISLAHPSSPVQSQILTSSSSLFVLRSPSDVVSILSITEEDYSSGMSTSISILGHTPADQPGGSHRYPHPLPVLPSSPSTFQLRSESRKDYLVERLERHLQCLSLADPSLDTLPSSLDCVAPSGEPCQETSMDVCLESQSRDALLRYMAIPELSSPHASSGDHGPLGANGQSSPYEETAVPMIVITSVNAKHSKPLPPSAPRSSRVPFGQSNLANLPTNIAPPKFKQVPPDDPFTIPPTDSTYPLDYNLAFHLPSFPPMYPNAAQYSPETPTPMNCGHFGDCSGDLWEILHPPLVSGPFTLPPFELPPLMFNDMLTSPAT